MSTISSTGVTTSATSSASSKGLSGLVSGMDTEQMVEDLLAGTQTKIDKANQQKQVLTWKQTMYRDVISSLQGFQNKYFSYTNESTNLLSTGYYSTMSATTSSSSVTATASSEAVTGTMTINSVTQLATQEKVTAGTVAMRDLSGTFSLANLQSLAAEKTLSVTLDGVTKSISLNRDAATAGDFASSLQTEIDKAFGNGISITEADGVISYTPMKVIYTDDGSGNLIASGTEKDTSRQIILSGDADVMSVLGLDSGASNKIALGAELGDIPFANALVGTEYSFTINDETFSFTSEDTLSSVISQINASDAGVTISYSSLEDKFSITSQNYGAGNEIVLSDTTGGFLNALFGDAGSRVTDTGKNAVLQVNGIEVQRNSNSFTIDGVALTLKETTNVSSTITVSRNTQQIADGITGFVNDYNSLIEKINNLIHQDATYKDYPALTSAQKKEMSDSEIELWEEKAQEGLLRGDSTLTSILSEIRSALFSKVSDSAYAIYDLGIDTSATYSDYGKLVISDKAKLTAAIESDPDSIRKLFTDTDNGIATRINTILNNAVKVSYSSPGSLIQLAGSSSYDEDTTISQQMSDIEERLETLQDKYMMEKERYWNTFTDMERLISQMNQQSAWLASQFG